MPTAPHRLWRALPAPFRRRALAQATAWLAPGPSPGRTAAGICVAGEFSRASGSGETARLMAEAARRAGVPVWTIDLPPLIDGKPELAFEATGMPPPGVPLIVHVNPPTLSLALLRLPRAAARRRPVIGYWAWETAEIPPEWHPALARVTEAWVPSRFTAAALEPLMPGRVRLVPPPLGAVPPGRSGPGRSAFGLPEDAVVTLVSFNLASSFARKNPFGAIAAFRDAFGDRPDRVLVLKINHADHAPDDLARIARFADAGNIRLDTRILPAEEALALTGCADIVLSLHRGEGFGLVLAEAMMLGKPVIATAWSGNTDFMNAGNSVPVGYRLVPARDDRAVYRGLWAEPDVAEASASLRLLADNPGLRASLGAAARASAAAQLGAAPLLRAIRALA